MVNGRNGQLGAPKDDHCCATFNEVTGNLTEFIRIDGAPGLNVVIDQRVHDALVLGVRGNNLNTVRGKGIVIHVGRSRSLGRKQPNLGYLLGPVQCSIDRHIND